MTSYRDIDWDTFWRWEIFRRHRDPVDYIKWKSDSSRELRKLPQGRDRDGHPPLILDSTCGLGYHAMAQHHLGFRVEACDRNERALDFARQQMEAEGLEIATFQATWERLGTSNPNRYDLIFNDEIHQMRPRSELLAALRGFHGALRPGGSLVFFFADAAKPHNGPPHADWDWEHVHQDRCAWSTSGNGVEVALWILPERVDTTLVREHHVYRIRDGAGHEHLESMYMERNYLWDWEHIVPVLKEAGFHEVVSHTFVNVHGNSYSMNLATRGEK